MSMRWLGNGPIFCSSFLKSKYQIKLHSKGFNAVNHDFRFFFFFFFYPGKRRIEVKCPNFPFISHFNLVIVLREHLHCSIMMHMIKPTEYGVHD